MSNLTWLDFGWTFCTSAIYLQNIVWHSMRINKPRCKTEEICYHMQEITKCSTRYIMFGIFYWTVRLMFRFQLKSPNWNPNINRVTATWFKTSCDVQDAVITPSDVSALHHTSGLCCCPHGIPHRLASTAINSNGLGGCVKWHSSTALAPRCVMQLMSRLSQHSIC